MFTLLGNGNPPPTSYKLSPHSISLAKFHKIFIFQDFYSAWFGIFRAGTV